MKNQDHSRAEALQWALNHAEAAEACDKAYRHTTDAVARQKAIADLHREATLANMWANIAAAMPEES